MLCYHPCHDSPEMHSCRKAICPDKGIILKRINNEVRQMSSLYLMRSTSGCDVVKSAKLGSYDRVLRKRRCV